MSYAGTRAEPSLRDEPVRSVRNIHLGRSNRKLSGEKDVLDTPSFHWATFVGAVKKVSNALGAQLSAANYEFDGTTLKIYPDKPFAQNFLSRDKNKQILVEAAGGAKVVIGDAKANPNAKKDELISKMSDIMGGEVINDGGDPF